LGWGCDNLGPCDSGYIWDNLKSPFIFMERIYMTIVEAKWTSEFNILVIKCHICDTEFEHRADRWNARCPYCHTIERLNIIRDNYLRE
jgi:Zn finger protein HypA/HybF involved in hydrogenase expression